jgi:hypothetical protein
MIAAENNQFDFVKLLCNRQKTKQKYGNSAFVLAHKKNNRNIL